MTNPFDGMDRRALLGSGAAFALSPGLAKAQANPIAATKAGRVRGLVIDGVNVFRGVRYGASTAGRRFLPALPPEPWTDVKDALDYGNTAPQNPPSADGGLFRSWQNPKPQSEDCLFLNVWTRGLRDGRKRPVMVWFHGGSFTTGSGSSRAYDGVRLARRGDVVVVTVNHRVNALGYTFLAQLGGLEFGDSGNVGNLDMVQSLRWVRDNIAEFGGDPNNVMIFGESGGGSKVSVLMAMPAAQGLFHRAAVQSGPQLRSREMEAATNDARRLMTACGLQPTQVRELQNLPIERLLQAVASSGAAFSPVFDARSLPRHPFDPDAPSWSRDVPLLVGTVKDENTMLQGGPTPALFDLTFADLPGRLATPLNGLDVAAVIAQMRRLHPDASAADLYFRITSERGFRRPAITQAERKAALAAAGGAPAYMYWLTWEPPIDGGKWNTPHAIDNAMVFDNVARSESIVGTGPDAQKVADAMANAWIRFARTGNPGWPAYNARTRTTMVFDVRSRVVNDPAKPERELLIST